MNQIYEIQFNENMNYIDAIKNMKSLGRFSVFNEYFYLNTNIELETLKDNLTNVKSIKVINKNNYYKISNDYCRNWCQDILSKIEIEEFEKSNQDYLKKVNEELDFYLKLKEDGKLDDFIKSELEKILKSKKTGGNNIDREKTCGKTKEK